MSPRVTALSVICLIALTGSALGFLAGARRRMDLEQWTVGGRGFGPVLLWLLMSGESYTTFSLLGASGWAYIRGGPSLYILAYMVVAFVVSFFLLPPLWADGKRNGLQTQPDYFAWRYESRWLAGFVALLGIVSMIPYLQLQITGLGIIVNVASFGSVAQAPAMVLGCAVVAAFVLLGGIRAVAWVSVLKDLLLIFSVVFVGIAVPVIHFGGFGPMISAVLRARPAHLTMPGSTSNLGHAWFVSSVLLSGCGAYMWPHAFGVAYTAKSADALRRNAIAMPLYVLTLPLVLMVGFAGILLAPGLASGDLAFLTVTRQAFPPWFLGIVGGAGVLTGMVPVAVLLLTSAALFTKNLFRPLLAPSWTDDQVAWLAKWVVIAVGLVSLGFALFSSATLVSLLLLGYAGITQLFPGVVLGLFWKKASTAGVFAGVIAGVVVAASLIFSGRDPYHGWNAGFLALLVNFAVTIVISWRTGEA